MVKTRFAPSPTGLLHIGNVRTALFAWLYARHTQGEFILRIEDTDHERSTEEAVQVIIDGMMWLGLNHDAGPIFQTDRYPRYMEIIDLLLNDKKAYYCNCSKERLEALRNAQIQAKEKPRYDGHCRDLHLTKSHEPQVIRFRSPQTGVVSFKDEVYGNINIENSELDDVILQRSDGHPTYNFAVVIDDWDMGITHVIRGDDHINNTPRQINLFNALNAPIPTFAHLPTILGEDGKRLSKRHGAVSILQFREQGYLPHALLNYIVRLGWASGDQEIFNIAEMIAQFSLANVSRAAASFDYSKLQWLNQHYMKQDAPADVARELAWHFARHNIDVSQGPALSELVTVQAERCKTLVEMCEKSRYFYQDNIAYNEDDVKKHLRPVVLEPLTALYERFCALTDWQHETLQQCINDISAKFSINMGKIAQPLRVAITGGSMSPSIDMTLTLIGKQRVLSRLESALQRIRERAAANSLS